MSKNVSYILGTVFLITSGLLYTLQRATSLFVWIWRVNAIPIIGNGSVTPPGPFEPFTNAFVPIFLLLGITLFAYGKIKLN